MNDGVFSTNKRFSVTFFRGAVAILAAVVGGVLLFRMLGVSLLDRIGMPHEFCYVRDPKLIWLHVSTDVLIGLAYVSISLTLAYLVYRASKEIPFNWVLLAFGLFIVSCGFTHFMEVWVVWQPVYWLSGYVKVVTAAASVVTAIALFPVMPRIFALLEAAKAAAAHRVEVEQLNDELERFNYSVAHDLRGPLRGINGYGEILSSTYAAQLPPEARSYLSKMQESARRMDELIVNLLEYASVGRRAIDLAEIRPDEAIRSAAFLLQSELESTRAELIYPHDLPKVRADRILLQVIFQNLIGNALKFVPPGRTPRIEITSQRRDGRVVLAVTDNGVGMSREQRARMFRLFERFHHDQPGTGIGLPIVQRAVERIGGTIEADDSPHGQGTQFRITLDAV